MNLLSWCVAAAAQETGTDPRYCFVVNNKALMHLQFSVPDKTHKRACGLKSWNQHMSSSKIF